jgi:hypothetical protein
MSRFFFSVRRDDVPAVDTEGSDLPDVEVARREAEMTLRELVAHAIKSGDESLPEGVVVFDAQGAEIYSIKLDEIFPKLQSRERP